MATASISKSCDRTESVPDKKVNSDCKENSDIKVQETIDDFHPSATRSLLIRNLDTKIKEKEINEKFQQFGGILGIHITKKQNSSDATVEFWNITSASKCLNLKTVHIGANEIELSPVESSQTDCIWLGNLADRVTDKFIQWQFSGCKGFSRTTVHTQRSMALVFFDNKENAQAALKGMSNKFWAGRRVHTDYASQVLINNVLQEINKEEKSQDGQVQTDKSVYLDYNATTPLDDEVLDTINRVLRQAWGNPSSSHHAGVLAKDEITCARQNVAEMIGGKPSDIIFTSGGTEANNMIIQNAVQYYKSCFKSDQNTSTKRPHIISTTLEHDSVKMVLEQLISSGEADVTFVPALRGNGMVDVEEVVAAVRPSTCLVTVMLANNETGVIQPVQRISELIHAMKRGPGETTKIFIHSDAAQAQGKILVNVEDLGVDYLTIVGHKFYGPRIGAIYAKNLEEGDTPLYPMFYGGGQEQSYRPGTENTGMIAGLGKAAEMVVSFLPQYSEAMINTRDYLEKQLMATFRDCVTINCQCHTRLPNTCSVAFKDKNLEGHKILNETKQLQASVGAACHTQNKPSPILLASGVTENLAKNTLRLSVGRYTSRVEIDVVIEDLKQAIHSLQLAEKKAGVWKPFQGYQ